MPQGNMVEVVYLLGNRMNVWEGIYSSFAEAGATGPGFNGEVWRNRSTQVDPLDYSLTQRNALLPFIAAIGKTRILDFGGGPGYGLMVLKATLRDTRHIEYHVVDLEPICETGKALFPDCHFHPDFPRLFFDLVHTSSTIQYFEAWQHAIKKLGSYKAPYLAFGDAFVGAFPTYVTVQNYYGSRIPHWFFNFGEFVSEVEKHGYELILQMPCHVEILGKRGPLPMDNFPEQYRLPHKSHLLFKAKTTHARISPQAAQRTQRKLETIERV